MGVTPYTGAMTILLLASLLLQGPPAPKPGPETERLKPFEGDWTVKGTTLRGPGEPWIEGTGTDSSRFAHGGLWLRSESEGKIGGGPFSGSGALGWDPLKKKYVMTYVSSTTQGLIQAEGDFDAAGKVLTLSMRAPGPTEDNPWRWERIVEIVGKDTVRMVDRIPVPDAEPIVFGRYEMTRKKAD